MSIQVYRSSFPIVKWDLNDDDFSLTKAAWAGKPANAADLPQRGTPGQQVEWPEAGMPSGYAEPTRAGFEFAGWSTDKSASAGGRIDGTEPKLTMPDGAPDGGEYTLYALWTPNEYSVIFDLAKNPEVGDGPGSDASFSLNWSTTDGVRTVTDLGSGRFRVDGFTMKESDYDATTRTVGLPEPSRTGYRFLGWAEPDGQNLAIDNAAKDGFAMNPVRLTQIDGTPVLTARWASAFGVTAPLSITFGDYDKTGAPGNPSLGSSSSSAADDTTQSEADDTETAGLSDQQRYEAAGAAYFENTGWNDAIKMVAVTSERDADANQVLTTYDSSKATEAQVLGDGTAANPGERLLSLYPAASAPADKSSGIHFRLSDSLSEADLVQLPSIAAHAKQSVTYGLNLSTDPVTGSANHGLVLETEDYEPKQIATVSYTFAVADAASDGPIPECLYIIDGDRTYGLAEIKRAAEDISAKGTASEHYAQFKRYLDSGMDPGTSDPQGYIEWGDGTTYRVRIIGLNHDDKADGSGKAGLTFQFVDLLRTPARMNYALTNTGGWGSTELRSKMSSGVFWEQVPDVMKEVLLTVSKRYRNGGSSYTNLAAIANDRLFILSYTEMSSRNLATSGLSQEGSTYAYWKAQSVDGAKYTPDGTTIRNVSMLKRVAGVGEPCRWWTRSPTVDNGLTFVKTHIDGIAYNDGTSSDPMFVCPAFCL